MNIRRLAVIIPSLAGGGMERMRIHLIREWVRCGIDVDLVVSRFHGPLREQLPGNILVFEVARAHPFLFPFGLRRYIKSRNPSHILSAPNDVSAITLLTVLQLGCPIPTVISVHSHLSGQLMMAKGLKSIKMQSIVWLLKSLINSAQGVIAVSQGVADDLKQYFRLPVKKLHVVYNPVLFPEMQQRMQEPLENCPVPKGTHWILYVGRFVKVKGLDILIKAYKRLSIQKNVHLVLMGDGPLKSDIATKVSYSGLISRIHLIKFQQNPLPWIRSANVIVLPSRHEGLPNVLIEALACGTQIVAADCPSGPSEILDRGKYGQLVPVEDPEALHRALLRSLCGDFYVPPAAMQERAILFSSERAAIHYKAILEGERKEF